MEIKEILERRDVLEKIESFGILRQYKKCKQLMLLGFFRSVDWKIRKPKQNKIYQFRITKKYRAFCIFEEATLIVIKIDKHQ